MSNYHLLKKTSDNRNVDLYVHLPIPATQTTAGLQLEDITVTYRWALKESLESTVSAIPNISGAEQGQLDDGELYEYYHNFRFSSKDLTDGQRRNEIRNGNDNEIGVTKMLTQIATPGSDLWNAVLDSLEWFGFHEDV